MKQTIKLGIALLVFLQLFISCKSNGQDYTEQAEYIKQIDSVMHIAFERELFNGNVLIVKNDSLVYKKSFGYTNASEDKALNSAAMFNIGSISKEINAVAIALLAEQGKLGLDDPISKFDLKLPKWSEKITIRHLLNYAGGLVSPDADLKDDETAFKNLRKIDSLLFEPGTNFNYNNYSVFLQQRIVEKVSNTSYKAFVQENLLEPLGMKNAFFDPKPATPNRTSCYDWDGTPCPELEYISGWLWMGIDDLLLWTDGLKNNRLISKSSYDTLIRNPYVNKATASLGEFFEERQLLRHNGTSLKYRSMMLNDFENKITIILLDNHTGLALELGHMLHDLMLGSDFELPKKSIFLRLRKTFVEDVDKGIAAYHQLKKTHGIQYAFDMPNEITRLGYAVLRQGGSVAGAIRTFQFGIQQFPEHANLYDSLGEAYFAHKEYDQALKYYKKAIALGGTNGNAKAMVEKIHGITR